jgi:hypothetical protein
MKHGLAQRSVVVLPSRSVDRWHESAPETRSYEERLLSFLFELRDPAVTVTYVTSLPVAARTIDYYISLLPRRARRSARHRLRLISLDDGGKRPLSEKLLERPRVLDEIRDTVAGQHRAYLVPYNSTALERDVAQALGISLYGADPRYAWLGTKSGGRALFARVGVPHLLGAEGIRSISDAVEAICRLRATKPKLGEVVIKLDNAVCGEGNAVLDLMGLPSPGTRGEEALIEQRLVRLVPEFDGVSAAAYLGRLAALGGVVEERITGRELRSPSVQLRITPAGAVELLSTHDQILHGRSGQQFAGCRFPADPVYARAISAHALRVGGYLADIGVIGWLAIDFLVSRGINGWQQFALEVNLRMGGTTHPYQTLASLTGGTYDPNRASFTTREGHRRHYVATDHAEIPQLQELGRAGLLARATEHDLRFDQRQGRGAIFHMLSSIEPLETVGITAIAESAGDADALHEHARTVLAHAGGRRASRARAARLRAALDTQA